MPKFFDILFLLLDWWHVRATYVVDGRFLWLPYRVVGAFLCDYCTVHM